MALWGNITNKIEPDNIIKPGGGVNTYLPPFEIKREQQVSNLNVSSVNYPSLSVRAGRTIEFQSSSAPYTAPNALGTYNGQYLMAIDGANLRYYPSSTHYVTLSTALASAQSRILEFNRAADRLAFITDGTNRFIWNGSTGSVLSNTSQAPATNLYTVDDFRLYALDGSIVKYSAAGDPTDWTTVDDAGQEVITGMIGTGTAIATYNDMVISWSDQSMHILDGNSPDDFVLRDPIPIGNVSDRGTIQHASNTGNVLYWLDYNRIMAFTGGFPYEIGQAIQRYLDGINYGLKSIICAGKYRKYIFWSIPFGDSATTNNKTIEYDTEFKTWNIWDFGILDFVNIGENLYGVDASGYIWQLNNGTDDNGASITWEAITGIYSHLPARSRKTLSNIYAIVDLPVGSSLTLSYSTEVDGSSTGFTALKTFTASAYEQNTRVQIPTNQLQRIDWYRLKMSGSGACTVHLLEPYLRINRR